MDHQKVAVHQVCQAFSAVTGLDFHHSNIKIFDDVMPVSAAMKRESEERLCAAILRLDEEKNATKRSEERLLDAEICREEKEMKEDEAAAAAAKRKEIMKAEIVAAAERWRMETAAAAAAGVMAGVKRVKRKEIMEAETVAAVERLSMEVVVVAGVLAGVKRKERMAFLENAGNQPSCALWCSHVGCSNNVHARGVCRDHGPRCSYVGCGKNDYARGVCKTCSSPAKEPL